MRAIPRKRVVGLAVALILVSAWTMAPALAGDPLRGPMRFVLDRVEGSEFHFRGEKGVAWKATSFGYEGKCVFDLHRSGIGNDGAIERGLPGLTFEFERESNKLRITTAKLSCAISHAALDLRLRISAEAGEEAVVEVPARAGLAFDCFDVAVTKTPDASVPK